MLWVLFLYIYRRFYLIFRLESNLRNMLILMLFLHHCSIFPVISKCCGLTALPQYMCLLYFFETVCLGCIVTIVTSASTSSGQRLLCLYIYMLKILWFLRIAPAALVRVNCLWKVTTFCLWCASLQYIYVGMCALVYIALYVQERFEGREKPSSSCG